jgi:hypothetical protein
MEYDGIITYSLNIMELQNAYHEIRTLQFKISELESLEKKADVKEVKTAYSTIQAVHVSTLAGLQTAMNYNISTLMGTK